MPTWARWVAVSFFKVNTHNFWGLGYFSGCAGRAYSLDHQKEELLFADLGVVSCKFFTFAIHKFVLRVHKWLCGPHLLPAGPPEGGSVGLTIWAR